MSKILRLRKLSPDPAYSNHITENGAGGSGYRGGGGVCSLKKNQSLGQGEGEVFKTCQPQYI